MIEIASNSVSIRILCAIGKESQLSAVDYFHIKVFSEVCDREADAKESRQRAYTKINGILCVPLNEYSIRVDSCDQSTRPTNVV